MQSPSCQILSHNANSPNKFRNILLLDGGGLYGVDMGKPVGDNISSTTDSVTPGDYRINPPPPPPPPPPLFFSPPPPPPPPPPGFRTERYPLQGFQRILQAVLPFPAGKS